MQKHATYHGARTQRDDNAYRNVPETERLLTGAGGLLLGLLGLRRGGLGGMLGVVAGGALVARAATGHCPAYARLGSDANERRIASERGWQTAAVTRESIIINRPREALYGFWRDFENLPQVMSHIDRVDVLDERRSHWVMSLPMGKTLEWDSRVTEDVPNERIAWQAEQSADVPNSGYVEFRSAPGGIGTEVIVQLAYEPPGGELGRSVVKLWPQAPGALLKRDLEDLRRRLESGQLALGGQADSRSGTSAGSPTQHH